MAAPWFPSAYVILFEKGQTTLVGHYGWVIPSAGSWKFGLFDRYENRPVQAYRSFNGKTKSFEKANLTDADVIAFLRRGRMP
jgi:hypothetical protein